MSFPPYCEVSVGFKAHDSVQCGLSSYSAVLILVDLIVDQWFLFSHLLVRLSYSSGVAGISSDYATGEENGLFQHENYKSRIKRVEEKVIIRMNLRVFTQTI